MLAVQETKLGASSDVAVDGFAVLRKDVRRGVRGLATFVRDDFVAVREPRLERDDAMLVVLPASRRTSSISFCSPPRAP